LSPKGDIHCSRIEYIHAREILDSRGNPTVEVDVETESGFGRASVRLRRASTGTNEALELRDKDKRYLGKGVIKAVNNVNNGNCRSSPGMDVRDQREIDAIMLELDGTQNKAKLGANAYSGLTCWLHMPRRIPLGYHSTVTWAAQMHSHFPAPTMNVINGGKHAGNELAIQDS